MAGTRPASEPATPVAGLAAHLRAGFGSTSDRANTGERSHSTSVRCNSHPIRPAACAALTAALLLTAARPAAAQPGWALSHQKISDTEGGFTGGLDGNDTFGGTVAALSDLDGDGVGDLAVGTDHDDDGARTAARCGYCSSSATPAI